MFATLLYVTSADTRTQVHAHTGTRTRHFNGQFPGEPGLAGCSLDFIPNSSYPLSHSPLGSSVDDPSLLFRQPPCHTAFAPVE